MDVSGISEQILKNIKDVPMDKTPEGLPLEPCRIFNSRKSGVEDCPDINIDYFPPLAHIVIYSPISDKDTNDLVGMLRTVLAGAKITVQDRSVRPFKLKHSDLTESDEFIVTENRLQYYVQPLRGQNFGFFADIREGRRLVGEITASLFAEKKFVNVLNLFAYTCSLSVAAVYAGASKCVNIDKNKRSLDIGRRNHSLNADQLPDDYSKKVKYLPHDIFKSFGKLKKEGPYNLIIADPPPSQPGSFVLEKDYPRLIRRLPEMLETGGVLLLSLNSPAFSWEDFETLAAGALPETAVMKRIEPPADFAPAEAGRGLKLLIVKID